MAVLDQMSVAELHSLRELAVRQIATLGGFIAKGGLSVEEGMKQIAQVSRLTTKIDAEIAKSPLHTEHSGLRFDPECIECDPDLSSEGSELIDMGTDWNSFLGRKECE